MNTPLVIANLLVVGAFFIYTFVGDKELYLIQPARQLNNEKLEKWVMARCGFLSLLFPPISKAITSSSGSESS